MVNRKQNRTKRPKMAERAQQQMDLLFPDYPQEWVWQRLTHDGYSTMPRTLPIAMQAIDNQTKGKPAGHTLFCLWARSPDHPLVTIENPATFAAEAGFHGGRAVHTWRQKMKKLEELNFIEPRKGPSGDYHYVLLINPNVAIEWMKKEGLVQEELYARFIARVMDIGAHRDVERIQAYWQKEQKKKAAAEASAKLKARRTSPKDDQKDA